MRARRRGGCGRRGSSLGGRGVERSSLVGAGEVGFGRAWVGIVVVVVSFVEVRVWEEIWGIGVV